MAKRQMKTRMAGLILPEDLARLSEDELEEACDGVARKLLDCPDDLKADPWQRASLLLLRSVITAAALNERQKAATGDHKGALCK